MHDVIRFWLYNQYSVFFGLCVEKTKMNFNIFNIWAGKERENY